MIGAQTPELQALVPRCHPWMGRAELQRSWSVPTGTRWPQSRHVQPAALTARPPGCRAVGLRGCCNSFGDWRLASGPWKYFTVPAGHRISQTCVAQCTENLSLPRPARGWCCQLWCVHTSVCVWLCEPSYWLCPPHLCDSIRPIFIYQMGSQRAGRPVCAENSSN